VDNKLNGKEKPNAQFIKGACISCKTPMTIPAPPMILNNDVLASSIIIPHMRGELCPKCGQYHNVLVAGYQVQLMIAPTDAPVLNEDLIIKPANILPFKGN